MSSAMNNEPGYIPLWQILPALILACFFMAYPDEAIIILWWGVLAVIGLGFIGEYVITPIRNEKNHQNSARNVRDLRNGTCPAVPGRADTLL